MNKNLMPKFHKIFRPNDEIKRNDIVSILGNAEDNPQKDVKVTDVQYQPFSMLYHDRARKLRECLEGDDVFVNIPHVSLWEVLEKLNEKYESQHYIQKLMNFKNTIWIQIEIDYDKYKSFNWILSDKSGEVPLHRQSKETIRALAEILCD